jgi:hypothetical protein
MTENQINFLLDKFFQHNHAPKDFPGWKGIAKKLIENGKCTVAGNGELWWGGIGNFIKVTPAPDAVDCSLLTFDVDEFTSTNNRYFAEAYDAHVNHLEQEQSRIQLELEDVHALVSD